MPGSLLTKVREYFYPLWNAEDGVFRGYFVSVGNKDAITGNRLFDRHKAVDMVKAVAKEAKDHLTTNAKDGDVYKHLVGLTSKAGMGLKARRLDYRRLIGQVPAE